MRARTRLSFVIVLVLALVAAACGGGSDDGGGGDGGSASGDLPECPVDALEGATKPVEIVLWHAFNNRVGPPFVELTDEFNASQSDVQVKLVAQGSYKDNFQKFRASLNTGELPDMVQLEDTATQQVIDTQAMLPAQSCIDADDYDMSDFLKRVLAYYSANDVLWPAYFNVSGPILYYDKAAFTKAGLDPEKPPTTLAEITSAAEKLKDAGYEYGFALKVDPYQIEQWSAKGGATYVNNGNGRKERATKVTWGSTIQEIYSWMEDMVSSGLALTSPSEGASEFDNYLAVRDGKAPMTIDTSAALATVTTLIESGQAGSVVLGNAPMPGPSGDGGVLVGGGAFYISAKSSPEKQAAAWKFAKFLNEPENAAYFSAGTGYVPIREAAVDEPAVQQRWAEYPGFKIAYDQLVTGVNNDATAGPLIGPYQTVRDAVLKAMQRMFTEGTKAAAALATARKEADAALTEYNERLGL